MVQTACNCNLTRYTGLDSAACCGTANPNRQIWQGEIMTSKANTMAKGNDVMTVTAKGFVAHNAPKANPVTIACNNIAAIANNGQTIEGLTKLGHKSNCKGGVIDSCILSGKVHTIEQFTSALINSGLAIIKSDIEKYGLTDTLQAILAHRTVDHVKWCANTLNDAHGGFGHRLAKVGLHTQRAEIAANLHELADLLQKQFSANYAKLYKNR